MGENEGFNTYLRYKTPKIQTGDIKDGYKLRILGTPTYQHEYM